MALSGIRNKFVLGILMLSAGILSGCLAGGGSLTNLPTDETAIVKLKIHLGRIDSRSGIDPSVVNKSSALRKGSAIQIQNLVVTFTSNLGDTLRDTVASAPGNGNQTDFLSDSVLVNVSLRAFRWWKIDIETHDQYDSVIHKGTAGPYSSNGGQVMDLSIPLLNARYLNYEARYALPAEIYSANQEVRQKIYFYRLVLQIDGNTIQDSTSFSQKITLPGTRFILADTSKLKNALGRYFFRPNGVGADTMTHVQSYEYVKAGEHEFKMSAYGYLEGDSIGGTSPRLLYQGKSKIDVVQGDTSGAVKEVKLDWMGPGSTTAVKSDSSKVPGGSDWNGIRVSISLSRLLTGGVTVKATGQFSD